MTFVSVNPGRKISKSNSIFDNLFDEFFKPGFETRPRPRVQQLPLVNIVENGDGFKIELAIPGLSKEDINIGVEKDILTIEAKKESITPEGTKVLKRGFDFSEFKRTFRLPKTIDTSKINASFDNGILRLSLAKKEEAKELPPRTIEIQ